MRLAALLLAPVVLAGCTYNVRIRNDFDQPLTARLIQTDGLMKDWTLAEKRVDPGETVQLGPARTMSPSTRVEIDPSHSERLDKVRQAVRPGDSAFCVGVEARSDRSLLILRSARWGDLTP